MKKTVLFSLFAFVSLNATQAQTDDSIAIGECQATLPTVDPQQCNQAGYYQTYRAEADRAINQTHDEAANEIHQDNQANAETVVSQAKEDLSGFLQCQRNVCEAYYEVCSSSASEDVSRRLFEENAKACIEQSENRFTMAKGLSRAAVRMNADRKAITTLQEKSRAIIARAKEITVPIMEDIAGLTGEWASKATHLIRQTRDAGPSVQSSGPQ